MSYEILYVITKISRIDQIWPWVTQNTSHVIQDIVHHTKKILWIDQIWPRAMRNISHVIQDIVHHTKNVVNRSNLTLSHVEYITCNPIICTKFYWFISWWVALKDINTHDWISIDKNCEACKCNLAFEFFCWD